MICQIVSVKGAKIVLITIIVEISDLFNPKLSAIAKGAKATGIADSIMLSLRSVEVNCDTPKKYNGVITKVNIEKYRPGKILLVLLIAEVPVKIPIERSTIGVTD